jgi:eukaryotic-like serine/threonine-protein kinase
VRLGHGRPHALSWDGKWATTRPITNDRFVLLPTGAGEPRTVRFDGIEEYGGAFFMPDRQRLLFTGREHDKGWRLYVGEITGGRARPVTPEGIAPTKPLVSPDGTLVLVVSPAGPMLYPLAGGEARAVPWLAEGERPVQWGPDAHTLFIRQGNDPMRVSRLDLSTGRKELIHEFPLPDPAGTPGTLLLTPDGRGYVYSYTHNSSDLYLVEGLR